MKPILKYLGGKRRLVPKIKQCWDGESRVVEPFVGGMSVALGLEPQSALLNDINCYVINLYTQIVKTGLPIGHVNMENTVECYYANRQRFNELISVSEINFNPELAELYYYLNRTSTNGLMRFNKKGQFNAAKGSYETVNYASDFFDYQQLLARWEFTTGDFSRIQLDPEDFVYADPPYDSTFTKYSSKEFDWYDQTRLANWLSRHPGKVVASNSATDRIVKLYENLGFEVQLVEMSRVISMGKGDARDAVCEMFAIKEVTKWA